MRRIAAAAACALLTACATEPTAVASVPAAATVPPAYQFEYGSGEAGALQMAAYHALIAYVKERAAQRPESSVVLAAGSPMVDGKFVPCGDKPLAAVFDVDETLVLNLGFEALVATGEPYDPARWGRWERSGQSAVAAVPGALHAMDELRSVGVRLIFISNRSAANAAGTEAMLNAVGLGPAKEGENLFLQPAGTTGEKDPRRLAVAARYCVIAMAGDQLGDFSDRFNDPMPVYQRRQLAVHSSAGGLWGKGWFVLPNPVYGTALKGGFDDVFPADKRWSDPEGGK